MSFLSKVIFTHEVEITIITGFLATNFVGDGYAAAPTAAPGPLPGSGPWSRLKGAERALGAGTIITQPHTSTGVYTFTLDQTYKALLGAVITPSAYNTDVLFFSVKANVTGSQTAGFNGIQPGTDPLVAANTVIVNCKNTSGNLADPTAVNPSPGGFFLTLILQNMKG